MDVKILNEVGNWDYWSKELLDKFEVECKSHQVGERIVHEDDKMIIWTIHLQPGKALDFHRHDKPYFWTVLTEGSAISYFDDGRVSETFYKADDTKNYPDLSKDNYFSHNLINSGKTELIFTTCEFKI